MSEIYVTEPPLKGKVTLHTTAGDLDIGLWSKECPLACRNFVQLCLEGYYDKTIFHRVIPDFLVQGGDPTGTGKGGQSIYDQPFQTEIHSRLKFRYRGLVGVANLGGGTSTNGSQFFITLGRADFLNKQNTLFGKVTGDTVYNLLRIAESETDSTDRPLHPTTIRSCEVIWNPFNDIVPRVTKLLDITPPTIPVPSNKREILSTKKQNLLSFNDDDDDNNIQNETSDKGQSNSLPQKGIQSAHDILNDPLLSKEIDTANMLNIKRDDKINRAMLSKNDAPTPQFKLPDNEFKKKKIEQVPQESSDNEREVDETPQEIKRRRREEEMNRLKQEVLTFKKGQGSAAKVLGDLESLQDANLMSEYEKKRQLYLLRSKDAQKRRKQEDVMEKLDDFLSRVRKLSENNTNTLIEVEQKVEQPNPLVDLDEEIVEVDGKWVSGAGLKFPVDSARAYALDASRDALVVDDPLRGHVNEEDLRKIRNQRMKPSLNRKVPLNKWSS